jgi:hypothetical protein
MRRILISSCHNLAFLNWLAKENKNGPQKHAACGMPILSNLSLTH